MFGSVPVISSQSRVASTPYNLVTSLTGLSVSSPSPSPQTLQAKQLFSSSPAMVNTTSQPGPGQPSDCSQTLQVSDNYNIIAYFRSLLINIHNESWSQSQVLQHRTDGDRQSPLQVTLSPSSTAASRAVSIVVTDPADYFCYFSVSLQEEDFNCLREGSI